MKSASQTCPAGSEQGVHCSCCQLLPPAQEALGTCRRHFPAIKLLFPPTARLWFPGSSGQALSHGTLRALFPEIPFWSRAGRAAAAALHHKSLMEKAVLASETCSSPLRKKLGLLQEVPCCCFFPTASKRVTSSQSLSTQDGSAPFRTQGCFQSVSGNLLNLFFSTNERCWIKQIALLLVLGRNGLVCASRVISYGWEISSWDILSQGKRTQITHKHTANSFCASLKRTVGGGR